MSTSIKSQDEGALGSGGTTKGDGELELAWTEPGELELPPGLGVQPQRRRVPGIRGRQGRRVTGSRGQPQLPEGASLPRSQVLEALQELAVSHGLVPPHRCNPTPASAPTPNCSSGCCSIRFFPGGPTLGSSVTEFMPVTRRFPPKQQGSANTNKVLLGNIFIPEQQTARRRLCSLHTLPHPSLFCSFMGAASTASRGQLKTPPSQLPQ